MFEYQQSNRYFAQISVEMQDLGINELHELKAKNIKPAHRGIYFEADQEVLYRANYTSRFITRILAPIIKFTCHNTKYLYRKAKMVDWAQFFSAGHSFAIFANVSNSKITHSQYAALCLKDAIVDYFRENYNNRPNIQRENPDVWISLHIEQNFATISLDTSGGSLHRRGYREKTVEAPMQETVAAAIIKMSGWEGSRPLYDPMCGSGTLLCEALMSYCNIAAGYFRKRFGFEFLPDYDKNLWNAIKNDENIKIRDLSHNLIGGSDISYKNIDIAKQNIQHLPHGDAIKLNVIDFRQISTLENNIIVCNPPYGIRLGDKNEVVQLYKEFGDFLKQKCKNSTAYIYFGDRRLIPAIALKPGWKKPLKNGGLDGRLCKFDIYE